MVSKFLVLGLNSVHVNISRTPWIYYNMNCILSRMLNFIFDLADHITGLFVIELVGNEAPIYYSHTLDVTVMGSHFTNISETRLWRLGESGYWHVDQILEDGEVSETECIIPKFHIYEYTSGLQSKCVVLGVNFIGCMVYFSSVKLVSVRVNICPIFKCLNPLRMSTSVPSSRD